MVLKYIGCAAILIFALVVSKEYGVFVNKRLCRLESYLDFLYHIERRISAALIPQHQLCEGFTSEILEEDFLPKLRDGGELYSAYEGLGEGVPNAADKILLSYFADFGKSNREGELSCVRETEKALEPILAAEKEAAEKNIKIFETVAVAAALGIIILLI